ASFGILRRHQGIVEVKCAVGKGTRFTIYLPRHDATSAARAIGRQSELILKPFDLQALRNTINARLTSELSLN
ncbi:MAG: hypothetical protein ACJAYX_004988, partial [Planctomycetota bacterium]